eukprot:jgi/Undpi1/11244/HiC_scaffold_30.g13542.m1
MPDGGTLYHTRRPPPISPPSYYRFHRRIAAPLGEERGARLRKREDERVVRRAKKRRKLGKKPLTRDASGGHEGRMKKDTNKRRLELARLERLVSKQEELLRDYRPPVHVAPLDPELKRKRRRRDFYDLDTSHWQLKGAARPAASLPGAGGTELVNEREDCEAGVDLFEKFGGAGGKGKGRDGDSGDEKQGTFYEGPEACREFLDLNHQLARALHDEGKESKSKEACSRYQRCLDLDPADHVMARRGLVRLLMDEGRADEARAVIGRFPDDRGCEMAWSLAAIEFVAWSVLEEEGAGQEVAEEALKAACVANPFLAWNIAHKEVVEHADEITDAAEGSVEEAFWYMGREEGLWASLEGSSEWVADFLLRNETLPPNPHYDDDCDECPDAVEVDTDTNISGNTDGIEGQEQEDQASAVAAAAEARDKHEMFASMFDTAVGMAAEMVAQQLGVDVEEEGEDGGGGRGGGGGGIRR